jgi:DNA-binding transcriptional regulator YiaG
MKPTSKISFGNLVRQWREARQLSRVDASKRLGIPLRTLESWEYGDRTPRGHYKRILEAKFSRP